IILGSRHFDHLEGTARHGGDEEVGSQPGDEADEDNRLRTVTLRGLDAEQVQNVPEDDCRQTGNHKTRRVIVEGDGVNVVVCRSASHRLQNKSVAAEEASAPGEKGAWLKGADRLFTAQRKNRHSAKNEAFAAEKILFKSAEKNQQAAENHRCCKC